MQTNLDKRTQCKWTVWDLVPNWDENLALKTAGNYGHDFLLVN